MSCISNRSKLLMASKRHHYNKNDSITPVNNNSITSCIGSECNSVDLIPIEGYITCRACGLCQAPVIDSQDEKRYHEEQPGGASNSIHRANSSMVGSSVISELVPSTVLGTSIGKSHGGSKHGDAKYLRTLRNDAKYKQFSSHDSATLKKLGHISNICKSAGINKRTIEEIQWTFSKLSNIKTTKRRKHQALMATATIIGCRNFGVEKDMNEIATKYDLDIRVLRKMVKQYEMIWADIEEEEKRIEQDEMQKSMNDYQKELDINHIVHIKSNSNDNYNSDNSNSVSNEISSINANNNDNDNDNDNANDNANDDSNNHIEDTIIDSIQDSINKSDNMKLLKYLRKLPIPECYHGIIFNINDWINTNNTLAQHIPISRYASVIYLAAQLFNLDVSKSHIVAVCGISEVTIKKCYSKLGDIEESMRQIFTQ